MSEHQHLLVKDPLRLGWKCEVAGCRFFKPAGEFDGIRSLAQDTEGSYPAVSGGDFRDAA